VQMSLIPVTDEERTTAAYYLVEILQAEDDEEAAWDEAKKAHKDTLAALHQAKVKQMAVIARAKQEHQDGITERQVNALLNESKELDD
jgi:hypothetical protein